MGVILGEEHLKVARPGATSIWIAKYIFPGGYVPALSDIATAVEASGFYPCDLEVWRLHYAETLRHRHDRFAAREGSATSASAGCGAITSRRRR